MMSDVSSRTGAAARLWMNGIFSVRIMWMMSVCESRLSMNQPDWKIASPAGGVARNTNHNNRNVVMSKTELIGPIQTMKRAIPVVSHLRGFTRNSLSIRSHGSESCEKSYRRLRTRSWTGSIGRNGMNALATRTLKTFPKFELAVILMYLMMLP